MRGRVERKRKMGTGRKCMNRMLAAMLALAMILCGMPVYGEQETALAASADGGGELYDAETGLYYEDIDGYYGSREYESAEEMVYSLVSEFSDILVDQLEQNPDERTSQTKYYINVTIPMNEEDIEDAYYYITYAFRLATQLNADANLDGTRYPGSDIPNYLSDEEIALFRTMDIPNETVAESFGYLDFIPMLSNGRTGIYDDSVFTFGLYCAAKLSSYADEMYASATNIINSLDIADEKDDYKKAYAVAEWMDKNVVFASGDNLQYASGNARHFLENYANGEQLGEFNCIYYAEVFQLLLGVAGLSAKGICWDCDVSGCHFGHEFNIICINGAWVTADAYANGAVYSLTIEYNESYRTDGWLVMDPVSRAVAKYGVSLQSASYYGGCGETRHNLVIDTNFNICYKDTDCEAQFHRYRCKECGAYYFDYYEIPHTFEITEYVAPTCEEDGYITYTCSSCGLNYTYKLEATGHDWEESITEATCTESGSVTYYCANCGIEGATYELYTLDHDWEETTSDDGLFTTLSCTRCGESYTFSTSGEAIDISLATVTLSETTYTYDGEYHCPDVVSVSIGSRVLKEGVDYKVDASGVKIGKFYVTIEGINSYTGTLKAYYSVEQSNQDLTASLSSESIEIGDTAQITADVTAPGSYNAGEISYKTSNASVAAVDSSGLVTGIAEGTAIITVTAAETTFCREASTTLTVTVYANTNISDTGTYAVSIEEDTYTYDGTAKEPSVAVESAYTTLMEGRDYTVNYSNNVNAGTASITVNGTGSYTGTVTKTFAIEKAPQTVTITGTTSYTLGDALAISATTTGDGTISWSYPSGLIAAVNGTAGYAGTYTVTATAAETTNYASASASIAVTYTEPEAEPVDISSATVILDASSYTYDGTAKQPSVTVKVDGTTLTKGTDYTVSYSNNTNASTASVRITGCGDYTGTVTKTFTINKASQTVTITGATSYTLGDALALSARTTGNGTISWSYPSGLIAAINGTAGYAGTYTVTATAAETDNYSAGSASITVTYTEAEAEPVDISGATVTLGTNTYTYDGTAKQPSVAVKVNGAALTKGTDYTVDYSNNINTGTATVTITGCGDYTGTATKTFVINKAAQTVNITSGTSLSLTAGGTATIAASASGGGALSYASSNASIATVRGLGNEGVVAAKTAGTAIITVTAAATTNYNAASATVSITVSRASQPLSVSPTSATLSVGASKQLSVGGAKTTLSYSSSNTSVATVSSSGKVTAKSVGTATITVTAAQTGKYDKAVKTVTINVKPSAPAISSVKNTTSGVKVSWGKVTGASGYYIYRSTSKTGTYTKVGTVTSGSTTSWTNKSSGTNKVTSGKTYYYKVYAYASTGTSSASAAKSVTYLTAGKISSLTNTDDGITVKWSKVSGASGYYVYRKASGASKYTLVKKITKGSTVSYTDTKVKSKNGTTYTYYVQPYNSSSKGAYATKKTVRLTAVTVSSVKNSASKAIAVKISKRNAKATGYQIQYSTSSSFASGSKTATITGASTLSKKVTGLTKGKTYYVRVRAYKKSGSKTYYSAWSAKKKVRVNK